MLKKSIKKINWKNLLERAFHSFWQGAIAGFVIVDFTEEGLKIALIGALTAGLSALKTFILDMMGDTKYE